MSTPTLAELAVRLGNSGAKWRPTADLIAAELITYMRELYPPRPRRRAENYAHGMVRQALRLAAADPGERQRHDRHLRWRQGRARVIVTLIPHRHGQMFAAELPNGMRIKPMKVPIFGAARALLALGFTPDTLLEFRHVGSDIIAASGIVGELAKWTIEETRSRRLAASAGGGRSGMPRRSWRRMQGRPRSREAGYLLPDAGERVLEADAA